MMQFNSAVAWRYAPNIDPHDELWFVAADQELLIAAQAEGLHVVDPTT
jgi:hypothetical protein